MAENNQTDSNLPLFAGILSLFLPGLGLLLSKEKKVWGIAIFVGVLVVDIVISLIGMVGLFLCLIGPLLWLVIPVIHALVAIHSYDVVKKEQGGKPIFFK